MKLSNSGLFQSLSLWQYIKNVALKATSEHLRSNLSVSFLGNNELNNFLTVFISLVMNPSEVISRKCISSKST